MTQLAKITIRKSHSLVIYYLSVLITFNYRRYAKIWKDCVSLTSRDCALIYLVDTAGTRTTSDQVNRDWSRDYCKEVYLEGMTFRNQIETHFAADHYRYKVEEDGSDVFIICNIRVSQARDGMVR